MIRSSLFLALVLSLAPAAACIATEIPPVSEQAAIAAREIDALLVRSFPEDAPGVAVLVARGDTVIYRSARGRADIEAGVPLKPEDRFRIGSVTKQFAAAGVLKLVEAGKVKLDDPLSKYVPGYPDGDKITVLQLLNHTSGVKSYTGIPGHMAGPIRNDLTTAQLIDVFKDHPVDFAPGMQWAYNNSGYVLVGAVIEAASGQPWHEYLRTAFFEPLGMRDTGYGHDPAVIAKQVNGYTHDGTKPVPAMPLSLTQPHAAGALVSNVDDLLRWNRALHEGRVLKSETYRRMITPEGKAVDARYGFGLGADTVRGQPQLQHGGGIFGFSRLPCLPARPRHQRGRAGERRRLSRPRAVRSASAQVGRDRAGQSLSRADRRPGRGRRAAGRGRRVSLPVRRRAHPACRRWPAYRAAHRQQPFVADPDREGRIPVRGRLQPDDPAARPGRTHHRHALLRQRRRRGRGGFAHGGAESLSQ